MKRKTLSLLLVIAMVMSLFAGVVPTALAAGTEDGTVYLSISNDEYYVTANDADSTVMAYLPVKLSELNNIKLTDYGLDKYVNDDDKDEKEDITLLHLYLYALDKYYMGYTAGEHITAGSTKLNESDTLCALTVTGDAGSLYMNNFWGHDENLTYYVNGQYPLKSAAWGATSDQIVLKDGDYIDLSMYTDWSFWNDSAAGYHYFLDAAGAVTHNYTATAGVPLSVTLSKASTDWGATYTTAYTPVAADYEVFTGTEYDAGATAAGMTDAKGQVSLTFPAPGTYYVWADGAAGATTESIVSAPAYAIVEVQPAPVTADITIKAQSSNVFTIVPQSVSVSSDLAESYGYTDAVSGSVSALDALVKAHQVLFGSDFTAETAADYLVVDKGTIKKMFGEATTAVSFAINGEYPHDPNGAYGQYGYTGYVINDAPIATGDEVEFFNYQDTYYMDYYTWFEENGARINTKKVATGVEFTLNLQGYIYAYGGSFKGQDRVNNGMLKGVEDAQLVLVNAETGEFTDIANAMTDENGNVKLKLDADGTYVISAYQDYDTAFGYIVSPWLTVTAAEGGCDTGVHTDTDSNYFCDLCGVYFGEAETTTQTVNIVPTDGEATFYCGQSGEGFPIAAEDKGVQGNYHVYELTVPLGDYSCMVKVGDIDCGGVGFTLPLPGSIYEQTSLNLVMCKFYTTNSAITAVGDFTLDLLAPGKANIIPGTNYIDSTITSGKEYVVAPRMVWAFGNAVLYNYTVKLNGDLAATSGVSPMINQTFQTSITTVQKKTFSITTLKACSVTAPSDAETTFYYQINNFNDIVMEDVTSVDNGNGTTTYTAKYPSFSNASYRVTKAGFVTAAGYCKNDATYTVELREGDPASTVNDIKSKAGSGSNIEYENSVLLNIDDSKDTNELAMSVDETFRLRAYRASWEIVNSVTANINIEPDFHYEVLSGSDVVSVTPVTDVCTGNATGNWMDVTALKPGTALIAVWYDAIDIAGDTTLNGTYGATLPERYGYVLVSVGADTTVAMNPVSTDGDWDAEFDTVYYFGDSGVFTFAPEGAQSVTVQNISGRTGAAATPVSSSDGTYNVPVTSGSNLITVTTEAGSDYMLVRAKKISYTIENKTTGKTDADEGFVINTGDSVCIHFDQLNMPVPKMAGVYNPGFGGTAKTMYTLNGKYALSSVGTQYDYIVDAKSCITFTAYTAGENVLSGGYIQSGSMGDDFGNHRNMGDGGRGTNFNAVNVTGSFGSIEDITFNVVENPDAELDYNELVSLKTVNIYGGTTAYASGFSFTAKSSNNVNSWTKTTAAMAGWPLTVKVVGTSYYSSIQLRYWYEGEEPVTVDLANGVEKKITGIALDASKILNMELLVTPGNTELGPTKTYSYVVYPGSSSLQYVHPIIKSLTATAGDATFTPTCTEGAGIFYTATEYELDVSRAAKLTLNGAQLQKYTNASNNTQDKSDTVTVYVMKNGEPMGEGVKVLPLTEDGYPVGSWTLADMDVAGADALKITVESYVNSAVSRTYNITLKNPAPEPVNVTNDNGAVTASANDEYVTVAMESETPVIDATNVEGEVSSIDVGITAAGVEAIKASGKSVTVKTPIGEVTLDSATAAALGEGAAKLTIAEFDKSGLSEELKAKIGKATVYSFALTVGESKVIDFAGRVKIVMPYEQKSAGSVVEVYYIGVNGLEKLAADYDAAAKTATFETTHFSEYFVEESSAEYTMYVAQPEDRDYNVGETVTADVYVYGAEADKSLASLEGALSYDETALTLTGITSELALTVNGGVFSYAGASMSAGTEAAPVKIATATFTVNNTIAAGTTAVSIGIDAASAKASATGSIAGAATLTGAAASVNAHNLTVTITAGTGVTGNSAIYYARYNEAGLYTANDYATKLTEITAFTAEESYILPSMSAYLTTVYTENQSFTVNGIAGGVAGTAVIVGADDYNAAPAGKELLIFTPTAALPHSTALVFDKDGANETALVYSDAYGAWTGFIPENSIEPEYNVKANAATGVILAKDSDVNNNGKAEALDAMIAYDMYNGYAYPASDEAQIGAKYMRLRADANGSKAVDASDVTWILRTVVGLPND